MSALRAAPNSSSIMLYAGSKVSTGHWCMIMSGMAETRPVFLFGCYMGLTFDLSDSSGWSRGYYSGTGPFFIQAQVLFLFGHRSFFYSGTGPFFFSS